MKTPDKLFITLLKSIIIGLLAGLAIAYYLHTEQIDSLKQIIQEQQETINSLTLNY